MLLSVIIPTYNEAKTIGKVLEQIFSLKLKTDFEVIVVDDGSLDSTPQIVKHCGYPVIYIRLDKNCGRGTAMRRGIAQAKGDFILTQDGDCEYDPREYAAVLEPALSGGARVVYGSRILKKENKYSYLRYYLGGRLLSWWTNLLFGTRITDEPTGYKLYCASLLKSLKITSKRFEFCPEVTAKIAKKGIKIVEVPISYFPRSIEEGKKIRWRDGAIAIWVLLRVKLFGV